jgi:hypothetical protein
MNTNSLPYNSGTTTSDSLPYKSGTTTSVSHIIQVLPRKTRLWSRCSLSIRLEIPTSQPSKKLTPSLSSCLRIKAVPWQSGFPAGPDNFGPTIAQNYPFKWLLQYRLLLLLLLLHSVMNFFVSYLPKGVPAVQVHRVTPPPYSPDYWRTTVLCPYQLWAHTHRSKLQPTQHIFPSRSHQFHTTLTQHTNDSVLSNCKAYPSPTPLRYHHVQASSGVNPTSYRA